MLVSVKDGRSINPSFVRDLVGTVETQQAQMGVLVTMAEPTRGMIDAVNHAGTYTLEANSQIFPRVQTITVPQLLGGERPKLPPTFLPYIQASKLAPGMDQGNLFS